MGSFFSILQLVEEDDRPKSENLFPAPFTGMAFCIAKPNWNKAG